MQRTGQRMSEEDINSIFVIGDKDQNGEIDLEEFRAMMMPSTSDVVSKFRTIRKTVKDVQKAFKEFDRNGDGSIDQSELVSALSGSFTRQEVETIFAAADIDGNGEIDYEEFIALMCPSASDIIEKFRGKYQNLAEVRAAFQRFDKNGDGALSKEELTVALKSSGQSYSNVEVDAIFSLGDVDGDGEITLEEFVSLMHPSASQVVQKLSKSFKNLDDVKRSFKQIDSNNDGLLSKQEMLQSAGNKFDREEVDAIFELGDVNGDGEIDMTEFISLMFPSAVEVVSQISKTFKNVDDVKAAFKLFDKDGDGVVTKAEMKASGHRLNDSQVEAIFALGDINDDGVLDVTEFVSVMCPSAVTVASRLRSKYKNINDVKKAFNSMDKDHDGVLSKDEIFESGKFNPQEIEAIFILGDLNQDGDIDLEEFVGLIYPAASMALARLTRNVKNISEARQMFSILDKNGDGLISKEEMRSFGNKFNAEEIEAIFAIGDINNDGEIDIDEFVGVMCPTASTVVARVSKNYKSLDDIKNGFRQLDRDGDGQISKVEMASAGLNEQQVNAIFKIGDSNNDGQIDLEEFISVMCPSPNAVVFKLSQMVNDVQKAFKMIDVNGDGLISKNEMLGAKLAGNMKLTNLEVDAIFAIGDKNKDGEIDLDEFMSVMRPSAGTMTVSSSSSSSFSSSFKSTSIQSSSVTSSSFSSSSSSSFCSVGMTFGSVTDAKMAFKRFDVNGDGVMDKTEMKDMMSSAAGKSVSDSEVNALFSKGDIDGDGQIDMQEFVKLMFPSSAAALSKVQKSYKSLDEVKSAFRKCDADGDGHISLTELRSMMSGFSPAEVEAVFALGDKDLSGGIDFNEYIALMIPNCGSILKKVSARFSTIQDVMETFKKIDANNDGAISRPEMKNGMKLNDQELDVVFALGDIDQDGEISQSEFVRLMFPAADSGLNKFRNSFRNIHEVVSAFKRFDANCDGSLCQQELVSGMKSFNVGFSSCELKAIFAVADVNQDGEINFTEFVSALFPVASDGLAKLRKALTSISNVKTAFKKLDANNDGEISFDELRAGMKSIVNLSEGEMRSVFSVMDVDNDSNISFSEFARTIIASADEKISQLKKNLGTSSSVQAAFKKFDVNNDGQISLQELSSGLKSQGMKFADNDLQTIFAIADIDGDGEISLPEFEKLLGTAPSFGRVEDVRAAFYRFDINNDGSIDKKELKQMLVATGKSPSDQEVEVLFKKGDIDGDGEICLQEFIRLMFPKSVEALSKLQKAFRNVEEIKQSFRKYDIDGDGHISRDELRHVMSKFSEDEVDSVFALGDMDQSGCIDYQEFVLLMLANASNTLSRLSSKFRGIGDIKSAFKQFDINKDGQISKDELKNGMRLSGEELDVIFAVGDLDGDGEINIGEFIRVMCPSAAGALSRFRNSFRSIEEVVSAFKSMDLNGDGALNKQELMEGMNSFGKSFSQEEVSNVFAMADINSDGEINYAEFVSMLFPAASSALAKFRSKHNTLKNAKEVFNGYDIDGDEEISYEELVAGMGGDYTANEINAIFAMGDTDQDGKISFLEFAKIMVPYTNEALSKFWKCFNNVSSVRQAFQKLDIDKDGQISQQEIIQGMSSAGLKLSSNEIETLFILGDRDSNGQIDFSEFAQIMIPSASERIAKLKKCFRSRNEIEAAFHRFDTNKDGAISFAELKSGLNSCGIHFDEQEVETVFALADRDCDGEVSMSEFVNLLSVSSVSGGAVSKFFEYCVATAFNAIDANRDGAVSHQELSSALRPSGFSDQEIKTIFALADHDKDGEISLNELLRALKK